MIIYCSTQIRPYVYICTHKISGKYYIGYRENNKIPSSSDIIIYKTSSKVVRPNFNEYRWEILAEFENGNDAYDFEQYLIHQSWGDPLLINEHCHFGKRRHKSNSVMSEDTKKKISKANIGKQGLKGNKNPMFGKKGPLNPMYGVPRSESTKRKISEHNKGQVGLVGDKNPMFGKKWSEDHKIKVREKLKNIANSAGDEWAGSKNLRESVKKRLSDGTHPAQQKTECPNCSKIIKGRSNYFRWHGENCRNKD